MYYTKLKRLKVSALKHGVMSRWTYIFRTCPNIDSLLQPLENILRTTFLPALTSQDAPENCLRNLLSQPCRAGGLGIPNPFVMSKNQFSNSLSVTAPLVELRINQSDSMPMEVLVAQGHIKRRVHVANHRAIYDRSTIIRASLPPPPPPSSSKVV